MSAQYFPFGQVPALSQPPVTYDIVMAKNFPRVSFVPTESGGIYQELVEVNGDLWFVTNATWDVNKLGFYQESGTLVNCNASQNAYAWVQRGLAGDAIRLYAAATNNPNTVVTWIPMFDAAPVGTTVSPLPLVAPGPAAFTVNTVFNGSTSTALTAMAININNVASAATSAIEVFSVNNVPVWLVDITGTLQIGKINPSQLSPPVYMTLTAGTGIAPIGPPPNATIGLAHDDYVDIPNNQSITGIKTIPSTTFMKFGDGWGNIQGGPSDGVYMVSGAEITNFPTGLPMSFVAIAKSATAMILAGKQEHVNPPTISVPQMLTLYINTGLTVGTTFTPTPVAYFDNAGNFTTQQDVNVGGKLNVTGGTTLTGPLTINGSLNINGNLVLSPTTVAALQGYFEGYLPFNYVADGGGHAGLLIYYDAANNAIVLDTSTLAYIGPNNNKGLISSDNSVTITKNMGINQIVDFSVATAVSKALPVYDYSSATKLTAPQIIKGSQTGTLAGTGGPNGFPSIQFIFNFAVPFTNGYAVAVACSGGWLATNVDSKSLSQVKVSVGAIYNPSSAITTTCEIVCAGS